MTELGSALLWLSFLCALVAACLLLYGRKAGEGGIVESGYRALQSVFFLSLLASLILVVLLLSRDFRVIYVYRYTSRDLPLLYTLSAFWAGQAGSLLLWELILSIYTVIVLARYRGHPHLPTAAAVMTGVHLFFTFLLAFVTDPFEIQGLDPADGMGLNPLLQNPGMIIHPPVLYLGYVGFTVPFAFAMAALIERRAGAEWIKRTRRWTILSWLFLTAGIVTGAQWAYVELGWGGYWAWDPVENASFIPWAVATAFLHSVMIQQGKGMLKVWNVSLVSLTFFLTIFGTFLTRSGVIQSVHSFGESTLGTYFLLFMALTAVLSVSLILNRSHILRTENRFEGILSKEASFLVNNVLLLGLAFATFWGTIFPIFSEAVTGDKVTVGPPFFTRVNGPIFLGIILLTGVCPLIAWRRSSFARLGRNLLAPMGAGALAWIVLFLLLGRAMVALAYAGAIFVTMSIIQDLAREAIARRSFHPGEGAVRTLWRLARVRGRKFGGYAIHLGVMLMAAGVVSSTAFKKEMTVTLAPGQVARFSGFTVRHQGIEFSRSNGTLTANGKLIVARAGSVPAAADGAKTWVLRPAKVFQPGQEQPHSDVDILRVGFDDLYAILAGYREKKGGGREKGREATFKLLYHPGVNLIWFGFYVVLLGGGIALYGPPTRRRGGGRETGG